MVAVQLAVVGLILIFAVYLVWLLALDVLALALNAIIIFALFSRMRDAIVSGLDRLYVAAALLVFMVLVIVPIPGFPIYKITWFLILVHALATLAAWAHRRGHADFSGLIVHHKKNSGK